MDSHDFAVTKGWTKGLGLGKVGKEKLKEDSRFGAVDVRRLQHGQQLSQAHPSGRRIPKSVTGKWELPPSIKNQPNSRDLGVISHFPGGLDPRVRAQREHAAVKDKKIYYTKY